MSKTKFIRKRKFKTIYSTFFSRFKMTYVKYALDMIGCHNYLNGYWLLPFDIVPLRGLILDDQNYISTSSTSITNKFLSVTVTITVIKDKYVSARAFVWRLHKACISQSNFYSPMSTLTYGVVQDISRFICCFPMNSDARAILTFR